MTRDFWEFAHERQAIWHRRFIEGRERPWTDDPVLHRCRFTNVHRELDFGTAFLRHHVLDPAADPVENVRRAILYRAFNNWKTWRVGAPADAGFFERVRAAGLAPTFGSAWQQTGFVKYGKGVDAVELASRRWNPRRLADVASRSTTLEPVYRHALENVDGFGAFTAWQLSLDLQYIFEQLNEEAWVHLYVVTPDPGTGAHNRQANLGGGASGALLVDPAGNPLETARRLRDFQSEELAARGLVWEDVAWSQKPRLTLADVEHTLCEYSKYARLAGGVKTKFRTWKPDPEKTWKRRES